MDADGVRNAAKQQVKEFDSIFATESDHDVATILIQGVGVYDFQLVRE